MKPQPKYRFMPGDRVRINERVLPEYRQLVGTLATVNRISLAVIHDQGALSGAASACREPRPGATQLQTLAAPSEPIP